jgi:hypothetical protein
VKHVSSIILSQIRTQVRKLSTEKLVELLVYIIKYGIGEERAEAAKLIIEELERRGYKLTATR